MPRSRALLLAAVAAVIVLLVVPLAYVAYSARFPSASRSAPGPVPSPPSPVFRAQDISYALAGSFRPGAVLGAASNSTTTLLGGIGVYTRTPELTLPALAAVTNHSGTVVVTNLTPQFNAYFWEGGVYGIGWNGTAWLIVGQAGWGGSNFGTAVAWDGRTIVNETAALGHVFDGGGVFALGWNGTDWLLGGNSTHGPELLSWDGARTHLLSGEVTSHDLHGWFQTLAWNGAEWLVGGEGVFGTLSGSRYVDLLGATPFSSSGAFAADWNGTAWLAGGGGGATVRVESDRVLPGATLPTDPTSGTRLDQAALLILPAAGGWLIGGKGTVGSTTTGPALYFWESDTAASRPFTGSILTPLIPASFAAGEIQSGTPAPEFGPDDVMVVGDGDYVYSSGHADGAIALLTY